MRISDPHAQTESLCISLVEVGHVTTPGPITTGGWDALTGLNSGPLFHVSARSGGVRTTKVLGLRAVQERFP